MSAMEKIKTLGYNTSAAIQSIEWTPRLCAASALVGMFVYELNGRAPKDRQDVKVNSADEWAWDWKIVMRNICVVGAFFGHYFYSTFRKLESKSRTMSVRECMGFGCVLAGFSMRCWAKYTLKRYFTYSLMVRDGQRIIQHGPYAIVRHPGYTGSVLEHIGYALWMHNPVGYVYATGNIVFFLRDRLHKEEQMLDEHSEGQYGAYMQKVKYRLCPYVY